MKNILESGLIKALSAVNYFPSQLTDRKDILLLLRKLAPVLTDKELIRLGPNTDGGYLVPNDLSGIEACFSPGVSFVSGFEKDCADLGMQVFLADKSVDSPADEHSLFSFTKKFIGAFSDDDFMTLDYWVESSLPESQSDLLLQIDIEGYEYEAFLSVSEALIKRFRIMVVEFHDLDQLWSKSFYTLTERVFSKILRTHSCIHIHPNNYHRRKEKSSLTKSGIEIPRIMEFTFLRKDRILHSEPQRTFPHPLDVDNTNSRPLVLPKCWYNEIPI